MGEPKKRLEGLSRRDFIAAMKELLQQEKIKHVNLGIKSRANWQLVFCNS